MKSKLSTIILKTGDLVGHLVAGVLAGDAINNAIQGNYEIAAIERNRISKY